MKIKIGQRKQASKINFEGEKIQNNKVAGHNCNKRNKVGKRAVKSWGHAVLSHKREREHSSSQTMRGL